MNIEQIHSTLKIVAIVLMALSLISAIGIWYTGRIVGSERQKQITALQPRSLSEIQRTQLIESLSLLKGHSVVFVTRLMDGESANYAAQLEEAFTEAGWNVGPMNRTLLEDFPGFITAAVSNDVKAKERLFSVRDAFLKAGIDFRHTPIQPNSLSIQFQPDTVYVLVGRKAQ